MEVPQDDDPFGKSMSQVFEPADSQETIHTKQDGALSISRFKRPLNIIPFSAPTRTTVKRKITETSLSTDMPENLKDRNRKKKKHKAKDEIDDIFGF
ncbi:hypothetical protein C0991_008211 [Blastosporella zonata]|nr:hypothetical protein C0991_008211 [Blastosporella zonata]